MSTLAQVFIRDTFANRPAASIAGRIFFSSDTGAFYRDNGVTWDACTIGSVPTGLTTKGDLFGYDSSITRVPIGTNNYVLTADSAQTLGLKWAAPGPGLTCAVGISIDGGGVAITTGVKNYISVPFGFTITSWDVVADQSGSITVEIDKHAAAAPNTTTDKISASAPVSLSSAQLAQSGSISGWTTAVSTGDVIGFNVTAVTTVTKVTITLRGTRT